MSISLGNGATGLQRLPSLKDYNALKRKNRFTRGLNAAKNTDYSNYSYLTNIFACYCICGVPVPAGFSGWFWPAKFLLLRCGRQRFLVRYSVRIPAFYGAGCIFFDLESNLRCMCATFNFFWNFCRVDITFCAMLPCTCVCFPVLVPSSVASFLFLPLVFFSFIHFPL